MTAWTVPGVRSLARVHSALDPRDRARVAGVFAVVVALHVLGWVTLVVLVAPQHFAVGTKTFGVGFGLVAYTLGMRHAFDADHIAAIDNTTRKLMSATDGPRNRPLTVGFWFSLGHSSVVFVLTLLLSAGATWLFRPEVHHYTALIGAGVSGTFLYLIAALNVVVLMGIVRVFAEMRQGRYDEEKLEQQLAGRGLLSRVFRRAMNAITKPWQMFPVGALFGLGFDTFTEVAFLLLAGSSVAFGLPWYAILCLPVLFAAGMSLLDTIDGVFMNLAYDWALARPIRKVYYNLTMTGLSVAVALLIGTVELVSVLGRQLGWSNGFYRWISRLDLNTLGYAIVALFAGTWAVAAMIWRFGRIEEKWAAGIVAPRPDPD